ncbi:hypothetical protein Prudu_013818 [Prunus dulcis]|uniref:Uncharacterized protein n=1 Tax=Prunus dulcis TaxID=3755 RepID=A0A4Y1RFM6_PRUDU|nr:hypothetical protein Prudu_013818 [Prunus dulcis]
MVGAIPVLNQVMGATRGATDALSGVSRHLRKLGAKNIEAGIGCGVGIGHGFGVGLAVKPGARNHKDDGEVWSCSNLAIGQGAIPGSLQRTIGIVNDPSSQNPMGSSMQLATSHQTINLKPMKILPSKGSPVDTPFGSRTEKVLSSFLQNPVLKGEESESNEAAGRLRSENKMLQMNCQLKIVYASDIETPASH